jgi:hypothetical protein
MTRLIKRMSLIILILFFTSVAFADTIVCGSVKSNKFHRPDCIYAKKIKKSYLIVGKPELFIKQGYLPCRICRPFIMSKDDNEE